MHVKVKKMLLRSYHFWIRYFPHFYFPYSYDGGRIYLDIKESYEMLARALNTYEPAKYHALVKYLHPNMTFVDVGANKGYFTLAAARLVGPSGRVLTIEPAPSNTRWIRKSIYRSGFKNVLVQELALSDQNGTTSFHLRARSGWHSLVDIDRHPTLGSIMVPTQRLDDLLTEISFTDPIDVIKLDVEGSEYAVLKGARETLERNRDIVLLLDIHPQYGVDPAELLALLHDLGFEAFAERAPFTQRLDSLKQILSLIARR